MAQAATWGEKRNRLQQVSLARTVWAYQHDQARSKRNRCAVIVAEIRQGETVDAGASAHSGNVGPASPPAQAASRGTPLGGCARTNSLLKNAEHRRTRWCELRTNGHHQQIYDSVLLLSSLRRLREVRHSAVRPAWASARRARLCSLCPRSGSVNRDLRA